MNDETLKSFRYYFQRILVPCFVAIGVLGNSISVVVLTRKWMRCSTNVYLTALAVADTIYLLLVLVLSLQHYEHMHRSKYDLYWRAFGLSHWLCDAASYTSIYITVSFTIERYIAVCHPIKGQALCTESRAKKVIAVVVILCLACTMTTTFEYQLTVDQRYIDRKTGETCELENIFINNTTNSSSDYDQMQSDDYRQYLNVDQYATNLFEYPVVDSGLYQEVSVNKRNAEFLKVLDEEIFDFNSTELFENVTTSSPSPIDNKCFWADFFNANSSALGKNPVYIKIFLTFTSIVFAFIPLLLLLTFNTFLIMAVKKSNRLRYELTNPNSRQLKQKISSISSENKITVTLIAVVILFIICQTPTAIYIVLEHPEPPSNIDAAVGNIFNFLITLNAASNFVLYCALSDKYRQTIKELIMGRRHMRQNTLRSSYLSRRGTMGQSLSNNRSSSIKPQHYHHEPHTTSIQNDRKPSHQVHRNSFHNHSLHEHRPSMTPSVNFHINSTARSRKNSTLSVHLQDDLKGFPEYNPGNGNTMARGNSIVSGTPVNRYLKPSESCGSLSRSQSMIIKPKTRHSPDCRQHPDNL